MAEMFRVFGRYQRPNLKPHQGFITLTPAPVSVQDLGAGSTVSLMMCRLDLDENGEVEDHLIDPNDINVSPGGATDNPWPYCVREVLTGTAVVSWNLMPDQIVNGEVDLGKVTRTGLNIVRPADWFPHHWWGTAASAGRISPP